MTYPHPPTHCTKDLTKPVTDEDIANAAQWYEANQGRIASALPVTVGGTTYSERWQQRFDRETLPQWRAGKLSPTLVRASIYAALRRLYRGMEGQS